MDAHSKAAGQEFNNQIQTKSSLNPGKFHKDGIDYQELIWMLLIND